MRVSYDTTKLERECTDVKVMRKAYGEELSKALRRRLGEIRAAQTVDDLFLGTGKWERLSANRAGQMSARLSKNWRLIIREGTPEQALVIEIVDYHTR